MSASQPAGKGNPQGQGHLDSRNPDNTTTTPSTPSTTTPEALPPERTTASTSPLRAKTLVAIKRNPSSSRSHARACARARSIVHPNLATVDERVEYIQRLMEERVWIPWTTRILTKAVADAWGLARPTIHGYASTANKIIRNKLRDNSGMLGLLALDTLSTVMLEGASSSIPGDKSAARSAAVDALKFAGLVEPEEDKDRPTTLISVGQVVTSPVFTAMLAGHAPKILNGTKANAPEEVMTNGHVNGHAGSGDARTDDDDD